MGGERPPSTGAVPGPPARAWLSVTCDTPTSDQRPFASNRRGPGPERDGGVPDGLSGRWWTRPTRRGRPSHPTDPDQADARGPARANRPEPSLGRSTGQPTLLRHPRLVLTSACVRAARWNQSFADTRLPVAMRD